MKFKYYLVMLVILTFFTIFLAPANAFTIQKLDKNSVTYSNGDSVITTAILSSNMVNEYKMEQDLNWINRVVIKLDGKTINKFNKGKTWKNNPNYYSAALISRKVIKGNVMGKELTVLIYDNKNKLIKSKKTTM